MIVVTGAGGFIGSCMVAYLNSKKFYDIVAVDKWDVKQTPYLDNKRVSIRLHAEQLFAFLEERWREVEIVIHLGARTDTTLADESIFQRWNYEYSVRLWDICARHQVPLIYASSAATYGNGEMSFSDDHNLIRSLKPMNPYAMSKHKFDIYALFEAKEKPYFWVGLKFFNVYGPNEYHKGRMASVVFHSFHQIMQKGKVFLFKSHREDYADGEQKRDFIYVKDIVDIIFFFMNNRKGDLSGIYNAGTGKARTFNEVAYAIFSAVGREPRIEYIPTPEDIRDSYQYFTEADITKLRGAGYKKEFTPLDVAINEYVNEYLINNKYW